MKTLFETQRLVAREFLPIDAMNLFKLNADKKVIEFTGDKPFKNIQEAEKTLNDNILAQYQKNGYGRWAIHLKANGLFIGWCGLKKLEETEEIDIGYRFHKRFWNKGFGTEIAQKTLDFGFEEFQLEKIIARAVSENIYSLKIMQKIEMQFEKELEFHGKKGVQYQKLKEK